MSAPKEDQKTETGGMGDVFCFGPTFRAENSQSRRHLAEFYMVEAEAVFIHNIQDLLKIMEKLIKQVSLKLLNDCENEIKTISSKNEDSLTYDYLNKEFGVITYEQAIDVLRRSNEKFVHEPKYGDNLAKEHELYLVQYNGGCPIFVIDWPKEIKPFYMKRVVGDNSKVSGVDLLVSGVGELCGGSLREDDYDILSQRLFENNLHEKLNWYLELRKFGNIPTGGFGMGFERFLQMLLGIPSIKDVIPFPRWPHNCKL